MNHTKIAIRVTVMNKVQFLLMPKPRKSLKPRSLDVIFLVEKDMRVERRRACDCRDHKKIQRQWEINAPPDQKYWNKEVWRSVAFVTKVRRRDKMTCRIMGVMEIDMVAKK